MFLMFTVSHSLPRREKRLLMRPRPFHSRLASTSAMAILQQSCGISHGGLVAQQADCFRVAENPRTIARIPMLIILGGLPGTGKTAIAWELARQLSAVYLRIDSIEQAIRDSRVVSKPLNDAGYRIGYSVAED